MTADIKQINLICGDEQYLREKKKSELLTALQAQGSVNFHFFEGKEADFAEAARLAQTMPFFEDHRTILLCDTGFFKGAAPEEALAFLKDLPETTYVIFYETAADAANRLYKLVAKEGAVFRYKKAEGKPTKEAMQDQARVSAWAVSYFRENGRGISKRAMARLLQLTGCDMLNLQSEMEKLIAYTESKKPLSGSESLCELPEVTIQDIEAVCSKTVTDRVFDMLSAKLRGDIATAMRLYQDLLSLKTPPMRVLYLLSKQFNQVYLMKDASRERIGDAALAERIGVKDWQLRKLREQSAKLSLADARKYLELCVETETKIKLGDLNDRIGVEMVLAS